MLHEAAGMDGERFLAGRSLTSTHAGVTKTLVFPSDLPRNATAGRRVLIATQGFAALASKQAPPMSMEAPKYYYPPPPPPPEDPPPVMANVIEREQPTETYVEARRNVRLDDGRRVEAMVFLSDTRHPQWAGVLSLERQAELIAGAKGLSGRNIDYLQDLVEHLKEMGLRDRRMERLLMLVEAREIRARAGLSTWFQSGPAGGA